MAGYSLSFTYFGIVCWITSWAGLSLSMISSARQMEKIKIAYFKSILKQEVGFYDTVDAAVISQL